MLLLLTWGMSTTQARHIALLGDLRRTDARAVESGEKAHRKGSSD